MIAYLHLSLLLVNFYMFRSRRPSSEKPTGECSVVEPSELSCVALQEQL
jgi:hypothetical protein